MRNSALLNTLGRYFDCKKSFGQSSPLCTYAQEQKPKTITHNLYGIRVTIVDTVPLSCSPLLVQSQQRTPCVSLRSVLVRGRLHPSLHSRVCVHLTTFGAGPLGRNNVTQFTTVRATSNPSSALADAQTQTGTYGRRSVQYETV